ncbi:MAG TPA: glutamyl-tRNA reductase [Nitrospiria bacterium]|jgi:glutamyl-tRNA reductase
MNIILVGLSHKTSPVEVREKFSFATEEMGTFLERLKHLPGVDESFILSTCNRVEICLLVKETELGFKCVTHFLSERQNSLMEEEIAEHLYYYSGREAIRHVFRVASSLDSMVVGEPQILGQMKEAFESSLIHKATGVVLNKVFKKAFSVAKRVRSQTKIGENAVSVSFAAVALAKKIFSRLQGKTALLVGAGEMAELTARHLVDQGVKEIIVVTRNYDRGVELANVFHGRAAHFEDFTSEMVESDIVICSAGAPHYLVNYIDIQGVIQVRKNSPIFLIDISVPRNIDPKVNEIDNVFLYDIDDLQMVVEANIQEREKEAVKAEEIILEEVEVLARWLKSLDVVPTIVAIREKAEEIRKGELDRVLNRCEDLSSPQRSAIEALSNAIVNKLLHHPLVVLKEESHSSNGSLFVEAARRLFQLESSAQPPSPSPQEEENSQGLENPKEMR